MNHARRPVPRAFALPDLLTVVAILTVLGSLLAEWLVHSARRSRERLCQENLGQVGKAILAYASDHEQRLPQSEPGSLRDLQWWYKESVRSYAGLSGPSSTQDVVFACPDDRGYTDPQPFHSSARFNFGSYVFNGVTLPGVPNIAGWELPVIRSPRSTLLVMEWTAHGPLSWHRSRTGRRNAPFYNNAESIVTFVDGHAALIPIYFDGYNPAYVRDPIPGYAYQYSGL